ncbi:PREDICTED: zinc finger BED domain-containing protein RICESLEEPER 2-like [Lupinus angustifolius]|uniref:zinc finger BED domain-containing protein RICESLEEPER 2-like n=1 Tax=Lupinus angustifolius TaxID=3871 RepID=UPI00092ED67C|nr:PREDICTED: zinc finger BED domain-containing protein RICESLEEPER 2-like [Lupinus angustifolius]
MTLGARYSNGKMREALASTIMMHELPLSIVDAQGMMWAFQYGIPKFQKMSCKTIRNDCIAIFKAEKKCLKALLRSVGKINLTVDIWRSNHQVVEYMVITGHFIDACWKLQKRVLSFIKVPAPRHRVDVADAISKCLKSWGIDENVFSISVDNSSYNDSCLKTRKENLSCDSRLVLDGALFHVRCCAHILNLLVQDGLKEIKDVVYNIQESVKYINHKDLRKLVIDCPTRWNSTFDMLSCALKFKTVFASYKDKEPHYNYGPSNEDWEKVEKVCRLFHVFSLATHVISGSEYPIANLYLAEVARVKDITDKASED